MKSTILLTSALALLCSAGALPARTWTSAEGDKTFDGELRSYDAEAGLVTVLMSNGREVTFPIDKLSEADREFLKEAPVPEAEEPDEAAAEEFATSKLGKALRKLEILDGKRFAKHELANPPEYFILYYSASW